MTEQSSQAISERLPPEATRRLVRTVDALADDDVRRPSAAARLDPGHVVAHLALNAEGLAGALARHRRGRAGPDVRVAGGPRRRHRPTSPAARPAGSGAGSSARRTDLADALDAVPDDQWDDHDRADAGRPHLHRRRRARDAAARGRDPPRRPRRRLHRGRLAAGVRRRCARREREARRGRRVRSTCARPTSTAPGRFGEGGPTVSGTGADLGWWLTGRGDGRGTDQRQRRPAADRNVVSMSDDYTGDVTARRRARRPRARPPDHHQGRGRPEDVQQLLPAALRRHRRARCSSTPPTRRTPCSR